MKYRVEYGRLFYRSKNIGGYKIFVSDGTWRCSGYASRRLKKTAVRKLHTAVMSVGYEKDVFPFLQERVELSSDLHLQMIFSVMI